MPRATKGQKKNPGSGRRRVNARERLAALSYSPICRIVETLKLSDLENRGFTEREAERLAADFKLLEWEHPKPRAPLFDPDDDDKPQGRRPVIILGVD